MNSRILQVRPWNISATKLLLTILATVALCLTACTSSAQTTASVTVNASSVSATVPSEGYGVNDPIYEANVLSSSLPGTFKAGGISAVRYPGGSYSDCFHWQATTGTPATNPPDYPGCSLNITAGATFGNFMNDVVNPSNAHAIVTVNYGSNAAGTGGGDPNEAAAWVQYANKTNNWGVKYWEIGNEIGGNGYFGNPGWEFDLHYPYNGNRAGQSALSPTAYADNTLAYISAMKAVDPTIQIGVGVWCPDTNNNNPLLFNVLASKLDFLIVHWYPGSSALSAEANIGPDIANIRNQIAAAGGNRNIPLAITETNAGGNLATAPDAVWNLDNYLTWFENGAVNIDYWEVFGSNGVLSSPTAPLDPYYAIQFSNTIARVGDSLVATSSNNSKLRSHAVMRTDGSVAVLLLNEDSSNSDTVSVSISGATVSSSGTRYTLNPSSGTTSSPITGVGNSFSVTVPAYSATAVVIPASTSGNLIANGTYVVTSVHSGTAIDDPGSSKTDGEDMQIYTVNDGTNQQWTVNNVSSNVITLTNVASGQLLDVAGASKSAQALVVQEPADGATHQEWNVISVGSGVYELTNVNSGLALDVVGGGTANGTKIDQYTYGGSAWQQWKFVAP